MIKRNYRTDEEWLALIQECRASGLTDKQAYDGKKNAVVITAQEMQAKDAYLIDLEEMPVKGMVFAIKTNKVGFL